MSEKGKKGAEVVLSKTRWSRVGQGAAGGVEPGRSRAGRGRWTERKGVDGLVGLVR